MANLAYLIERISINISRLVLAPHPYVFVIEYQTLADGGDVLNPPDPVDHGPDGLSLACLEVDWVSVQERDLESDRRIIARASQSAQ